MDRATATRSARLLVTNVERVIRGKRAAVEAAATALFAGGHLLVEDIPGVGKTMLGRALARSLSGSFKRVQATPDLLPSDITGSSIFNQRDFSFEFIPGPIFANVVLLDEVNRTTPRTQSALLEAMEEHAVTVDGTRHVLPEPLFVIATQNPLEQHGTYPLPEGQLDRFSMAMELGYVDPASELQIVRSQLEHHPIEELQPVLSANDVIAIQLAVRHTDVADDVLGYALSLVAATRKHPALHLGASPRALVGLVRCAQARALLNGRSFVTPDDVKVLAGPVLGHRILPTGELRVDKGRGTAVVAELVDSVPVPVITSGRRNPAARRRPTTPLPPQPPAPSSAPPPPPPRQTAGTRVAPPPPPAVTAAPAPRRASAI
ncbi:MAG: MoxR family ATPase [Actinomycetota bacterium]|nr:MoxR family ATPase [Actinomycetota bacterium]